MSITDTNNKLLREMLGKGSADIFTTSAQEGKDYYAVHFPVQSVIATITFANATGSSSLNDTTIPAGTILRGRITAIQLTSGIGIGYTEEDADINN